MKIALRQEEGIAVLEISGTVDLHNFNVLKAGISKLLSSGKNRIALSLLDATELQGEVIRELAIIDIYAKELAGKIILVSSQPELKESVKLFARPPVIPILPSMALALDYFRKLEPAAEDDGTTEDLKKQLELKAREVTALEIRLKAMDPRELLALKAKNADLQTKVTLLEAQVEKMARHGRQPVDAEAVLDKVAALEDALAKLAKEQPKAP